MFVRSTIWEPKNTNFRPYNISTLITFYLARLVGGIFRKIAGW